MKEQSFSLKFVNLRTTSQLKTREASSRTQSQTSVKFKEQLKQKQLLAELSLTKFVQRQKQRKQTEDYFSRTSRNKTESITPKVESPINYTGDGIMKLLEEFSELNFNQILSELKTNTQRNIIVQQIRDDMKNALRGNSSFVSLISIKQQNQSSYNNSLNQPANRRDVQALKEWLKQYLQEAERQKQECELDEIKTQFANMSDALYLCFQELIRQVSLSCTERGSFLYTIFKGYILLYKKQLQFKEQEKQQLQDQFKEQEVENQLQKDQYDRKYQNIIQQLKNEIDNLKKIEIQNNEEKSSFHQNLFKLQKKLDLSQQLQKSAVQTIHNLQREIIHLEQKLAKKEQVHQSYLQNQTIIDDQEEQDLSLSQVLKEVNQKTKLDQNLDMIVKDVVEQLPIVSLSIGVQTYNKVLCAVESQTELQLINPQYDKFLTIKEIENTYKEFELKQQLEQQSWLDSLYDQIKQNQDDIYENENKVNKIELIEEVPDDDSPKNTSLHQRISFPMKQGSLIETTETSEIQNNSQGSIQDKGIGTLQTIQQGLFSISQQSISQFSQFPSNSQLIENQVFIQKQNMHQLQKQKSLSMLNQDKKITQQLNKVKSNTKIIKNNNQQQQQQFQSQQSFNDMSDINTPNLTKEQINTLMLLYQIQKQKVINANLKINESNDLLTEILLFARKLTVHILKTQFKTHTQIAEEFLFEFETLRKKISNDKEIQEDEYVYDEDKEKEQKKKEAIKRRNGRIQKAIKMNFVTKSMKNTVLIDKLIHPGVMLAVKAKEQSHLFTKVVSFWPVKNVLRTITQIYNEKLLVGGGEIDMQIFVFNFLLNKYGFKHVAEKKYMQFLLSLLHFSQIYRVNVFSRLMALIHEDSLNFTQEETSFFLQGLEFITNSNLGVNIVQADSETKVYVPYLRALDYIKIQLENKLTEEEIKEIRNDLEILKEPDIKNIAGIIDIDQFMVKVLEKYRIVTHRTKLFVIHAFQAADLDGNKKINHNEFLTLYRHIENEKFDFQEALDLFDEQADIIHQGEKNLSFNRFTSVCVNQQIFTEQSLNDFIGGEAGIEETFWQIVRTWITYKTEVQGLLAQLQPFVTAEIYQDWVNILYILEKRISSSKIDPQNMRPILIAHKILKLELTRLLQDEDEQNQKKN